MSCKGGGFKARFLWFGECQVFIQSLVRVPRVSAGWLAGAVLETMQTKLTVLHVFPIRTRVGGCRS